MRVTAMFWLVLAFAAAPLAVRGADATLEEAYELEGKGEYRLARKAYEALALAEAKPGPATLHLARLLRLTGDHAALEKLLATALADGAAVDAAHGAAFAVEASHLARDVGQLDLARERADLALTLANGMIEADVARGMADLDAGKREPALVRFEALFDNYDPNGRTYTARELTALATAFFELAMKTGKVDRSATLKTLVKDNQDVKGLLGEAMKLDPHAHEARWLRGKILLAAFETPAAKKNYLDGLKVNPNHPLLRLGLCLAHMQNYGTLPEAPGEALKALAQNPKLVEAYEALASLYLADELYAQAKPQLDKALAINPNRREALSILAGYHRLRGEQEPYLALEKRVLALDPGYGEFYFLVAAVLEAQRQFDVGVELCRKAVELDKFLWPAWIELAGNLLRTGQEDEAKKALEIVRKEFAYHTQSTNYLKLLAFYDEYVVGPSKHFRMRFHVSEDAQLRPLVSEFLDKAYVDLSRRYGFEPQGPLLFEMFHRHDDFTVRTIGLTGLGALGACFGKVVTMDSPRAFGQPFNWAGTAWHEFAHVVTLQLSGMRVPRWFTEGLSEYEEYVYNPSWVRPMHHTLYEAWTRGSMRGIETLNAGFSRPAYPNEVIVCYFQGGLLCRFIAETYGFDRIPAMLKLYAQGKQTPEVIQGALGLTMKEFDEKSIAWFKANIFDHIKALPSYSEDQLEDLKDALDEKPDDVATRAKLAAAYFSLRKMADANLHAGRVLQKDPANTTALLVMGRMAHADKDVERARKHLEAALAAGAVDFHAHLLLGHIYKGTDGDLPKAIASWSKAKAANPFYVGPGNPYALLAEAYKSQGKEDARMAELAEIAKRESTDIAVRAELVSYHVLKGQHEAVVRYAIELAEVDPYQAPALVELCQSLVELRRYREAVTWAKHVIELKPETDLHRVFTAIARAYMGLGDLDKARAMAKEAVALKPDYKPALELLEDLK